jgi:hypothetical protein
MRLQFSLFIFLILFIRIQGEAQDPEMPVYNSSQLEAMAERNGVDPQDDSYELDLEAYLNHRLNLNAAGEEDLVQLHLLKTLQISNFLSYRKLLGPLLTVYELQAVPGWDLETIRSLLPYINIGQDESLYSAMRERWKGGDHALLIRTAQTLEKSRGFEKPVNPEASYYEGSALKVFLRYTYNYKNLLAFGFIGEKDAGEPFFRGAQRYGFDFYSFHFFIQHTGIIRALALGDFTVNLGQGLIQWQGFAITKSSQTMAIKREAMTLRPYHSAGEFNFHRGIGISLQKAKWQTTLFLASQKISTNTEPDTTGREDLFSSFENSGYHRTPAEIADRYNSSEISAGGNIQYGSNQLMVGLNGIYFQFSRPFKKMVVPYNLYSLTGTRLTDYSFNYHYTLANLHLFGELAVDQGWHPAIVQGALISLRGNLDMSFLYRNISPAFQSLYSDAFTENSVPNNEKGFYAGIAFRPAPGLQLDFYQDLFIFPWLKYGVDAPSGGRDLLVQVVYSPDKYWRLTVLFKNERKELNSETTITGMHEMKEPVKKRWRIETDYSISKACNFSGRMEFVRIDMPGINPQLGFLGLTEFGFRKSGFAGNMAAVIFETNGYDTRLYLYEPDLLYNFSLPVYFGKGLHYYINLHRDFSRLFARANSRIHISAWLKWDQTFYPGVTSIGTGLDEIPGNRRSELKAQLLVRW